MNEALFNHVKTKRHLINAGYCTLICDKLVLPNGKGIHFSIVHDAKTDKDYPLYFISSDEWQVHSKIVNAGYNVAEKHGVEPQALITDNAYTYNHSANIFIRAIISVKHIKEKTFPFGVKGKIDAENIDEYRRAFIKYINLESAKNKETAINIMELVEIFVKNGEVFDMMSVAQTHIEAFSILFHQGRKPEEFFMNINRKYPTKIIQRMQKYKLID